MCGIFFCAHSPVADSPATLNALSEVCQKLRDANALRGPDAQQSHNAFIPPSLDESSQLSDRIYGLSMEFFGAELRLRGVSPVIQPHDRDGNFLCWNGEVFGGIDISPEENDGVKLFELLVKSGGPEDVRDIFGSIEGPYAFVFYHRTTKKLYFARDPLGRRSLLMNRPTTTNPYLLFASVSAGENPAYSFEEISTEHIHMVDLQRLADAGEVLSFETCSTSIPRKGPSREAPYAEPAKVNTTLPSGDELPAIDTLEIVPAWLEPTVDDLIYQLDRSVYLRVRDIPQSSLSPGQARVAVLFSGGIDSTVITLLADRHLPKGGPIDLLNVAFENPRKIRLKNEGNIGAMPKREQKRKAHQTNDPAPTSYMVPDRVTGLQELEELRRLCPDRIWNFVGSPVRWHFISQRLTNPQVEVDVPYQESQEARSTVEALMVPGKTVMDLSLALALYFASRGVGQVRTHSQAEPVPYTSTARVLLNGLGSDELLGGYGRHRTAYTHNGGWKSVIEELQLEIERIPTRNLGRDDRVISSHGKETRHPFLDLNVVSFVAGLPVHHKMDPRLGLGIGDKMLLRLAAFKLGLVEASSRKKKAMQFGSQSARMDGEKRVPLAVAIVGVRASLYDVPGGYQAVMFDRFSGVKGTASGEGTHFLVPWLQRAILYDCRIKPRNISTTTGSKDLQMVSLTLRVLSRPDKEHLPKIYQSLGLDYDERVLPSIGNEVLKSIVAQFDAAELITQREVAPYSSSQVSSRIREDLLQRAGEFNILLEDVSITHLTFGKEFTQAVEAKQIAQQDAERAKFIVEKAEQERQAAVIRAEGEAEAAKTISQALDKAGEAFVAFRKIEASKAIAQSLATNPNVTYVPSSGNSLLLQVPQK
ncbi:hypothetical protein VNI00_001877 [Paramarasmius palmivorus]|uniref:Band 7 domain-containing protein n=1 Tax=Paramarasmius palmivorus TaxID=297713 RepID=A0AAW0E4T5_9AGAR